MVRKLLKHEAIYYSRTFFILEAIIFGLAIFTRLMLFFEFDSIIFYILMGSSYFLFGLASIVCLAMTTVIGVFRFYKNLFSNEGYLSFTLPVSVNQHLFVKLVSVTVYSILIAISVFLGFLITVSGDITNETFKAIAYLWEHYSHYITNELILHAILFIIEFLILSVLSIISNFLLYYTCIAIGQTAKKNRILMAVLCYFAYATITEILSTIFSIITSVLEINNGITEKIGNFISSHPYAFFHIVFLSSIAFSIIFILVTFLITRHIMSKKLNLE